MKEYSIHTDDSGQRLDRFIRKLHPGLPMSEIFAGIRKGKIKVNRKKKKHNEPIVSGDRVQLFYADDILNKSQKKQKQIPTKNTIQKKRILFEDEDIFVYNKPSGLVVHKTDHKGAEDTLIDLVQSYLQESNSLAKSHTFSPALAHRIDRETSGTIIIAKTKHALDHITDQFRARTVKKTYVSFCHNIPEPKTGTIHKRLSRTDEMHTKKPKVLVDEKKGLQAKTRYTTLGTVQIGRDTFSLIETKPKTGRMHQIRVHLSSIGCPIVGDKRYLPNNYTMQDKIFRDHINGTTDTQKHHYLHALSISFIHPKNGKEITITSDWNKKGADLLTQFNNLCIEHKSNPPLS